MIIFQITCLFVQKIPSQGKEYFPTHRSYQARDFEYGWLHRVTNFTTACFLSFSRNFGPSENKRSVIFQVGWTGLRKRYQAMHWTRICRVGQWCQRTRLLFLEQVCYPIPDGRRKELLYYRSLVLKVYISFVRILGWHLSNAYTLNPSGG